MTAPPLATTLRHCCDKRASNRYCWRDAPCRSISRLERRTRASLPACRISRLGLPPVEASEGHAARAHLAVSPQLPPDALRSAARMLRTVRVRRPWVPAAGAVVPMVLNGTAVRPHRECPRMAARVAKRDSRAATQPAPSPGRRRQRALRWRNCCRELAAATKQLDVAFARRLSSWTACLSPPAACARAAAQPARLWACC